jgi:hypothetical protein
MVVRLSSIYNPSMTPHSASSDEKSAGFASEAPGMGAAIAVGTALGLLFGTMLDNLGLGLALGAGIGTVAGAVVEARRRRA